MVGVRVGENGVGLEGKGNVGKGDKVSELLGGMNGKPKLVVWAEEHGCVTEVSGGAGVLVVLYGAGDPFFYGGVVGGGAKVRGSMWGGYGSVAIEGYLDGGERWDF